MWPSKYVAETLSTIFCCTLYGIKFWLTNLSFDCWILCLIQCLQALEKISREQPLACLQSGAVMAVLNYIDFFSTSMQVLVYIKCVYDNRYGTHIYGVMKFDTQTQSPFSPFYPY